MRLLLASLLVLFASTTRCEGIVDVLQRSEQQRLEALTLADPGSPATLAVRQTFDVVLQAARLQHRVELRVIRGDVVAETMQGDVVVANESLADLPEGERMFILAHELGHIALGHGSQMRLIFQKWVPGAVTPEETNAVAASLGRDAAALAHNQEYEADAYGLRVLHLLGHTRDDALSMFMRLGPRAETATHPGTRRRMAALRAADEAETTAMRDDVPASALPDRSNAAVASR